MKLWTGDVVGQTTRTQCADQKQVCLRARFSIPAILHCPNTETETSGSDRRGRHRAVPGSSDMMAVHASRSDIYVS